MAQQILVVDRRSNLWTGVQLGFPASIHALPPSSASSQSVFSRTHTPGLLRGLQSFPSLHGKRLESSRGDLVHTQPKLPVQALLFLTSSSLSHCWVLTQVVSPSRALTLGLRNYCSPARINGTLTSSGRLFLTPQAARSPTYPFLPPT